MSLIISNSKDLALDESLVTKLQSAYKNISFDEGLRDSSINIRIVDDKEMISLNKKFRNKNSSTNVLSFTNEDISSSHTGDLGDIAISYETCIKQSKELGVRLENHVVHLLVHACLHLLGFTHQENSDFRTMKELEIKCLKACGIENPYAL